MRSFQLLSSKILLIPVPSILSLAVFFVGICCSSFRVGCLLAEDVVVCSSSDGSGSLVLTGEIESWSRSSLELQLSSGQIRKIDSSRLRKVRVSQDKLSSQALYRMEQKDYKQATPLFSQIIQDNINSNNRGVKLQEALGLQIRCYENLGNLELAAQRFALLSKTFPNSYYSKFAPLVWTSCSVSPTFLQAAQQWGGQQQDPFLSLTAASALLSTPQQSFATSILNQLAQSSDSLIAQLARFQLLRQRLTAPDPKELSQWESDFRQIPLEYQSGPAFQMARLYSISSLPDKVDKAALFYMNCALNPNVSDPLAARALYSAGKILADNNNKNNRKEESLKIFNELIARFPQNEWASFVRQEIE